ncbi:hypothetical protein ScPMuIL_013074 [Solemya velum]
MHLFNWFIGVFFFFTVLPFRDFGRVESVGRYEPVITPKYTRSIDEDIPYVKCQLPPTSKTQKPDTPNLRSCAPNPLLTSLPTNPATGRDTAKATPTPTQLSTPTDFAHAPSQLRRQLFQEGSQSQNSPDTTLVHTPPTEPVSDPTISAPPNCDAPRRSSRVTRRPALHSDYDSQ